MTAERTFPRKAALLCFAIGVVLESFIQAV